MAGLPEVVLPLALGGALLAGISQAGGRRGPEPASQRHAAGSPLGQTA